MAKRIITTENLERSVTISINERRRKVFGYL